MVCTEENYEYVFSMKESKISRVSLASLYWKSYTGKYYNFKTSPIFNSVTETHTIDLVLDFRITDEYQYSQHHMFLIEYACLNVRTTCIN